MSKKEKKSKKDEIQKAKDDAQKVRDEIAKYEQTLAELKTKKSPAVTIDCSNAALRRQIQRAISMRIEDLKIESGEERMFDVSASVTFNVQFTVNAKTVQEARDRAEEYTEIHSAMDLIEKHCIDEPSIGVEDIEPT